MAVGETVSELLLVPTGVVVVPAAPWYHWYDVAPTLFTTTVTVVDWPALIVREVGWVVITGGLAQVTVMTAVLLLTLVLPLQVLVTRTQYDLLVVMAGVVKEALFVPTGVVVVPLAPSYH